MPLILSYGLRQQIKTITQSTKVEESRRNVDHTWHSDVIIYKAESDCPTSTQQLLSTHILSMDYGLCRHFFTMINWKDLD